MLMLILTWTGIVLALSLMLIMALGPVIVEADAWWQERKHAKRRRARSTMASWSPSPAKSHRPTASESTT